MDDPAEPFPEPNQFDPAPIVCPHCGAAIDPSSISAPIMTCPQCNQEFFAPGQETDEEPDEEEEKRLAHEVIESELSELRIKQLSTLLRANYRTRSYFIVGTLGCFWSIMPLVMFAKNETRIRGHFTFWSAGFLLAAVFAVWGGIKFAMKWKAIQQEINANWRARAEQEAEAAKNDPDWSTLSDGSQQAKKLEGMFGGAAEKRIHGGIQENASHESPRIEE